MSKRASTQPRQSATTGSSSARRGVSRRNRSRTAALHKECRGSSGEWKQAIRGLATPLRMLDNFEPMIHVAALDQVMKTLTQEARTSLSNATPQPEAVKRLEEVVRVHP